MTLRLNKLSDEYKNIDRTIWKNPYALSGKAQEEFLCPHCNRYIKSKACFERWHNHNCKLKGLAKNEN